MYPEVLIQYSTQLSMRSTADIEKNETLLTENINEGHTQWLQSMKTVDSVLVL